MRKTLVPILIVLTFICRVVSAQDNVAVAMVADIQGQVMIEIDGQMQPCEILAELDQGSKLYIESDTTLTLFYFDSSEEYTFDVAGEILIGEQQPQAASGNQAVSRNLNMEKLAGIAMEDEEGIGLGLLKLRNFGVPDLQLIGPMNTKVLTPTPEFTWHPVDGVQTYQFILSNDLGLTIADISLTDTGVILPDDIKLDEGTDYTWEVVAQASDDVEYRAHANFSVLEDSIRQHVESTRPDPAASFSERAVYARMLERLELKQAATNIWLELALLRPGHASLQHRVEGKTAVK